jgi:hypothetical protein
MRSITHETELIYARAVSIGNCNKIGIKNHIGKPIAIADVMKKFGNNALFFNSSVCCSLFFHCCE